MSENVIINVLDKLIELNKCISDKPATHVIYDMQIQALVKKLNEYLPHVTEVGLTYDVETRLRAYNDISIIVIDKLKKLHTFKILQLVILKDRVKRQSRD